MPSPSTPRLPTPPPVCRAAAHPLFPPPTLLTRSRTPVQFSLSPPTARLLYLPHAFSLFIPRFHGATQRFAHDETRGSSVLAFLKSSSRVPIPARDSPRYFQLVSLPDHWRYICCRFRRPRSTRPSRKIDANNYRSAASLAPPLARVAVILAASAVFFSFFPSFVSYSSSSPFSPLLPLPAALSSRTVSRFVGLTLHATLHRLARVRPWIAYARRKRNRVKRRCDRVCRSTGEKSIRYSRAWSAAATVSRTTPTIAVGSATASASFHVDIATVPGVIVITPAITCHHLHHRRSRGLLDGDAVRQCSRRAAVRLRRGPPWLRHADGVSHRSGEFHRGNLVGHDERFPLRGQPATGPANSLEPRIDPATATSNIDTGFPSASHYTDLTSCTGFLGYERAFGAHSQRQFDIAERLLGGEQQRARPAPYTGQEVDRHTSRFLLRRSRLRRVHRRARRWTSGCHSSFPFVLGWLPRRLELQSPSSPGLSLLVRRSRG